MDTTPTDIILARYHHHLVSEKRYSPRTVVSYESDLNDFLAWLEKQKPDTEPSLQQVQTWQVRQWVSQLHRKGLSGKSLQRKLSSIRRVYRFLLRENLIEHNPVGTSFLYSLIPSQFSSASGALASLLSFILFT